MSVLRDARVLLAVTGGIAAYKAADLASKLVQAGARVEVILSRGAREFVGPATFEALTKRPVHGDVFEPWTAESFGHITLGHDCDILVVAPATAHVIAKLAHGMADDMIGAAALSTTAPVMVVPAMEHVMYHHPATQANLATLKARGGWQVGPERGRLASGEDGDGRMASVETIQSAIRQALGRDGPLAGKTVVISAGGTQEPIDPVRFIGNRSSGLMGFELARAALDAGASVRLVTAPTHLASPYGAETVRVNTALDMQTALTAATRGADVLIMSAAVADFRPANPAVHKLKKGTATEPLVIELTRNPDIVAGIEAPGLIKVGFAAETNELIEHARAKLRAKGLSLIVANDAAATIGSPDSTATLIDARGETTALPRMSKAELAETIIERVARLTRQAPDAEAD